jgi:hypothetical protein
MQTALEGDMDVPLARDESANPQIVRTFDLPLTDIGLDELHNPVTWTSSWGFEGLEDFGDIESIFR